MVNWFKDWILDLRDHRLLLIQLNAVTKDYWQLRTQFDEKVDEIALLKAKLDQYRGISPIEVLGYGWVDDSGLKRRH